MSYYLKCFFNLFENENVILEKNSKTKIWIGNINTSRDLDFFKKNNIKLVINCTKDLPQSYHFYPELHKSINFQRIPVNDSRTEKDFNLMSEYMGDILDIIKTHYNKEENVLIFCRAGKQRSAIISALVLYDYYKNLPENANANISKYEIKEMAFNHLYEKRPQVFTCGFFINFEKSFDDFIYGKSFENYVYWGLNTDKTQVFRQNYPDDFSHIK